MLYLKSRVHFHEVKLVSCCIKNEFNSTSVVVTNSFSCSNCGLTNLLSQFWRNTRRSLFNNFLVASLNSAITLVKINIVSMFVTEYLYLDVSGFFYVLFKNHVVVFKSLHRLILG